MTLPHPPSELFRKFIRFGGARLPLPRTLWPGLPSSRLQYTYTDGLPAEYCESFSPRPGSIFSLSLTLLTFHPGCLKLFWRQHVWTTAGFSINPLQNWMKWSSFLECIWLERRAGSWAWTCTTFMTAVKVSVRKGTRLRLTLMLVFIIIKMVTWWCWMLDVGCVPQSLCSRKVSDIIRQGANNSSEPGLILIARWWLAVQDSASRSSLWFKTL